MSNADLTASSGLIINFELASKPAVRIVTASSCGLVVNARSDLPLSVKDDSRKLRTSKFGSLLGESVKADPPVHERGTA